jgi:putative endonuclease
MNRKATGDSAEQLACRYLQTQGLKLLQRNFYCRGGEIDLVMQHGDSLVFVEVRYRQHTTYGRAAETISERKQSRVIRCAQYYINLHQRWNTATRFDVVSIEGEPGQLQLEWIRDAFRADARCT